MIINNKLVTKLNTVNCYGILCRFRLRAPLHMAFSQI